MAAHPAPPIHLRPAELRDLDQLVALEHRAFATDRMSRRSLGRMIRNPRAALIVAEQDGSVEGYAAVLFRRGSDAARLYSIAVRPEAAGRGLGKTLLSAAEEAAMRRGSAVMRLEVHEKNTVAIRRYDKSGYRRFGEHRHYYEDRGHALRLEKRLTPTLRALAHAPPYFHQTTEFTCGPACVMMALGWADRAFRPHPILELDLWREATTIFTSSGAGGCEAFGLALALRRRGLYPEIFVSRAGACFLDTVRSEEKRRVMRLVQGEFRRAADQMGIATHLAPLGESVLMRAFDRGAAAIILTSGYHMVRRRVPHWVFAFGHEGGRVLVHDPAAVRKEAGKAAAPETFAIPWITFWRATRVGRDRVAAAILTWKGPPQ